MKTIEILSICYPDYFTGYNRPVIAVPVFNNMLMSELAEGIKQELNNSWDYFTEGQNAFTKTEMLIIDEYINKLKNDGDNIFIGEEFNYSDDDNDTCYAYLSICKPVYNYGIKFLN